MAQQMVSLIFVTDAYLVRRKKLIQESNIIGTSALAEKTKR
jgi:hypothetical protein